MRSCWKYLVLLLVLASPVHATNVCASTVVVAADGSFPVDVSLAFDGPQSQTYLILDGQLFAHRMIQRSPEGAEILSARKKVILADVETAQTLNRRWSRVSVLISPETHLPVLALVDSQNRAYLCHPRVRSPRPPRTSAYASRDELEEDLFTDFTAHRIQLQDESGRSEQILNLQMVSREDGTFQLGATILFGFLFESEPLPLTDFSQGEFGGEVSLHQFTETRSVLDFVLLPSGGMVALTSDDPYALVFFDRWGEEKIRQDFPENVEINIRIAAAEMPDGTVMAFAISAEDRTTFKLWRATAEDEPKIISQFPQGEIPIALSYSTGTAPPIYQEEPGARYFNLGRNAYKERLVVVTQRNLERGPGYRLLALAGDDWTPLPWNSFQR